MKEQTPDLVGAWRGIIIDDDQICQALYHFDSKTLVG